MTKIDKRMIMQWTDKQGLINRVYISQTTFNKLSDLSIYSFVTSNNIMVFRVTSFPIYVHYETYCNVDGIA